MVAEARLKSKNLYKVELYLLKIMPMVIALAYLVNTVSSYFGVDIPILASIAGMSLIPLIFRRRRYANSKKDYNTHIQL